MAFAVVVEATFSIGSLSVSAIFVATNGRYALSLRLPLCGTGARYGESVSNRILFSPIEGKASRSVCAFLKVTTPLIPK